MKKTILFALSLFFCLMMNAQIQRTFFGLELGKATTQEVEEMLRNKGLKTENVSNDIIATRDVSFGGEQWSHAVFKFYEDRFFSVVFGMSTISYNRKTVKNSIAGVISILKEKYSPYIVTDEDEHVIFSDMVTMASISFENIGNGAGVYGLTYSDIATMERVVRGNKDDF